MSEPETELELEPYQPRAEDVVVLLAQVPERATDVLAGLDAERLRHRHASALPTLGEVLEHLAATGPAFDAVLRSVVVDGAVEVDLAAATQPVFPALRPEPADPDALLGRLEDFTRDRRRLADLLRGVDAERWAVELDERNRGRLTLLELVSIGVHHETAHVTQLRNLLALLPEPRDLGPVRGGRR